MILTALKTKCQRREAQNCESFLKKKVPDLKVSASGIELVAEMYA